MSWRSDSLQLVAGGWLSSAYPGLGAKGWQCPTQADGDISGSLIRALMGPDFNEAREYRLEIVSSNGIRLLEDGSGSATGGGAVRLEVRIYEDGAEL